MAAGLRPSRPELIMPSTQLLGAYALEPRPIDALLDVELRATLCAPLGGQDDPISELCEGRLWLRAEAGSFARGPTAGEATPVLAVNGLLARGDRPLSALAAELPQILDGHFSLCHCADPSGGALILARSLSGGEPLYVARIGGLLLFSASLRPLLAHPEVGATANELDHRRVGELLLSGTPLFGGHTPLAAVQEVLPGHRLLLDPQAQNLRDVDASALAHSAQRWHIADALRSPSGAPQTLARRFRQGLCEAIEAAVGRQRPIPVALSGGIDSSAVAAAAVEVAGPDEVFAFTYEFDDDAHNSELDYARSVSSALGIRDHVSFRVGEQAFVDAIPECVWRAETAVHWPKAFMLPVARQVRAWGFDRFLTGFGIGSHMSYFRELGRLSRWIPPRLLAPLWRAALYGGHRWLDRVAKLHPGLEPPHPRVAYLLLRLLEHQGLDLGRVMPAWLTALADQRPDRTFFDKAAPWAEEADAPLWRKAQLATCAARISCIDVTRSEKASRELGVQRIAPAHFSACLPYAYFPIDPPPRLWSADRLRRPGKQLLQLAYRGVIPDEVLFRVKDWADAVASPSWIRAGRVMMLRALPRFAEQLRDLRPDAPAFGDAALRWEPRSILAAGLALLFWRRVLLERPAERADPPTWRELHPLTPSRVAA